MEHIAIMKKSWGMTKKVLSGEKKIESRWYNSRYTPWNKIKIGEVVYFKDSGEPVTIKAEVEKVRQFSELTPKKVKEVLEEYGNDDGISAEKIQTFYELFKRKKYCLLIFLKNPQETKPFKIDKSGFGSMSAWISVEDVSRIKMEKS
jgi:ASC-1-like (ASCH) protein